MNNSIWELKRKAVELEVKGELKKALKLYEQILKKDPRNEDILYRAGSIYLNLKNKTKGITNLLRCAEVLEEKGLYKKLIPVYKKILNFEPSREEIYKKLAEAYYKADMIADAGKTLEKYVEIMFNKKKYKEALDTLKTLVSWQPDNYSLKESVAQTFIDFKKREEAKELLKELFIHYKNTGQEFKRDEIKEKLLSLGMVEEEIDKIEEEIKAKEEEKTHDVWITDLDDLLSGRKVTIKKKEEVKKEKPVEKAKEEVKEEAKISEKTEEIRVEEKKEVKGGVKEEEKTEVKISAPERAIGLAESYLILGDYSAALESFYDAFNMYMKDNLIIEAYKVLKKIADKWPEELRARKEMVKIAYMLKNKEQLLDSIISLGECLYKRGATDEALKWFEKAFTLDPNDRRVKEYISLLAPEKMKKKVEKKAVKVPPEKEKLKKVPEKKVKPVKKEKAEVGKKTVKKEEVEEDFISALKKEIEKEAKEKPSSFIEDLKESVHRYSKEIDFKAKLELGIAMKEMGLYQEAIMNLKEASKKEELKGEAYELIGMCYMEMRKYDIAIEYFEEALKIPNLPERRRVSIEYHLGECYERVGDKINALLYYKKVFEKNPKIKGLKEKIEIIESENSEIMGEDRISFL